jgi:hypothetical protein
MIEKEQAFYRAELEPLSLWDKLKGNKPTKNAVIEINNLLSERALLDVSQLDIQAILDQYGLNLYKDFDDGSLRELYKKYLRYCFEDNHLDEDEIRRLRHLKRLLGLTDKAVEIANHQICQEVYERELDAALQDLRLDEKELTFLKNLQNKLQLPQSWVESLYHHKAQSIIVQFIKGAIADERLSPDEEEELKALIEHLDVEPQLDEGTQAELAKYRLFWQIENGELPPVYVPIKLKSEEHSYFLTDVDVFEERKNGKEEILPNALRVKLTRSDYWRCELNIPFEIDESLWKPLCRGKVYITNQRLILREKEQEKSIRLQQIRDFSIYPNGVMFYREKQKRLFLLTAENTDVFSMILGRILREM